MKQLIILMILIFTGTVNAGPYVGVYWLEGDSHSVTGAEVDYSSLGPAFVIGGRTEGKYGFFGEAGLSGEGVLAAAGGYMVAGPVEFSLAAAAIPDTANGVTRLGVDSDSDYGIGPMVGVQWKWLSARAAWYDIDHDYEVIDRDDQGGITDRATSSSSASRTVYWLGVVMPFD